MPEERIGDWVAKIKTFVKGFKKTNKTKKGKTKYNKIYIELWQCKSCDYEWAYKTHRCPLCSCMGPIKIV